MSTLNQIQSAILQLGPGAYQKLLDNYLYRKRGFSALMPYGSADGTDKTTKGTPDTYIRQADGRFIFAAYGTVEKNSFSKIEKDIKACLDEQKTGIRQEEISEIICCHTSTNLGPGQDKSLHDLFPGLTLIGLGDLSLDLLHNYPGIVWDELHIEIDTHQILDLPDFIAQVSAGPYAVPLDIPLLCREKELAEIGQLINDQPVTLIFGAAGTGKTRLAIEAAKDYADKRDHKLRIIKSNGLSIYNDLVSVLTDDSDFVILVDDVDQLTELQHLLDLCFLRPRNHECKLIMTVRDYARERVIREIEKKIKPACYELPSFSQNGIAEILRKGLQIENPAAIKRVQEIAKGNARLSVMAGMCIREKRFDEVRNAFELYDHYYSNVITRFSKDELVVGELNQ